MNESKITFEEALSRLEEIVKELENGSAMLDKSLEIFEEGVSLVKLCTSKLDEAEQRVSVLMRNENGGYDERPFGTDKE